MSKPHMGAPSREPGVSSSPPADEEPGSEITHTPAPGKHARVRSVKSFRMRDDLSHRIEMLAAEERRKIYEVVEEALEIYLAHRGR